MQKSKALAVSAVWALLPCFAAGGFVGSFFTASFWYWAIGIAGLAFFYVCLDRIPTRLFDGAMRGLPLGGLLRYGYTSTDMRPDITEDMIKDENEWRSVTYNHFYGNDR